ncbi:DUF5060 domain-containing protein [Aquimarina algiphila]|uniref:DUF5060 domain-containing protein n=1 Tax=Aquimarina algiphila TaxID=2047982 RepID=UPI0024936D61|nr:DUF4038 domain-containing protein [Aquimarina algiphila]
MKQFISILFLLILVTQSIAQHQEQPFKSNQKHKIKQWEILDILLTANTIKNPFKDSSTVIFTNSSGNKLVLPLIYNGNTNNKSEWLIRFSSAIIGTWTFITQSEHSSLDKKEGTVTILPNKDHKGGVRLSKEDTRNFYYESGEKYTPIAFECDWLYALDYHNEKKLSKTNHLLNLIKKNGFNQIVMNVFSYDVSWKKDEKLAAHPQHEFGGPENIFPFLGTNDTPDFSSLNVDFFKKYDRTLLAMHERQLFAHIMIYVWNKLVKWPDMQSDADNLYYDYVIKRYQAFPNVLWDVSKEALYYGRADEAYISERIQRIRKQDSYKRLITVHDYGFCKKHGDEVDYISSQDWSHNIYNKTLEAYTTFKNKPIFNIEHGGYETSDYTVFTGDYTNAEVCLRRNYMCLFAGAGTTYYWQGTSWNVVVYNPFQQPEDSYKPKFDYFQYLSSFWKQFADEDLKPAPWMNSSGYALANKKGLQLHYVPKENFQIKLGWVLKPEKDKTKTYYWFNTLTGETTTPKPAKGQGYINPWRYEADAILVSKITEK